MAAEILGTGPCPECDHQRAQLKQTASGAPYRYCPACKAQYFPRRKEAQRALCKRFGVDDPELIEGAPESARVKPKTAAKPAAKPAGTGQPKPAAKPAGTGQPKPAAKPAASKGWFPDL
jgi:hypothetical protein